MYHYVALLFTLLWTITQYGAGPVLLANKWKKPVRRWQLATFCVLYTFLAWLAHTLFLSYYSNGQHISNATAAVVWGLIFHAHARRVLRKRGLYEPPRQLPL